MGFLLVKESPVHPSPAPSVDTSSKARKRNRNKARPATPPPPAVRSSAPIEGILANKDEKSPVVARAPVIPHPKLATSVPKDEVELAKQHQQQAQAPAKAASARKPVAPSAVVPQDAQRQRQQEQPFTTVGGNRHKTATPPLQQPQQQQPPPPPQDKPVTVAPATATVASPPVATQPLTPVQVQHVQMPPRQAPRQHNEAVAQQNGFNKNTVPVKQQTASASAVPSSLKIVDIVKGRTTSNRCVSLEQVLLALPTSQAVVSELMVALDAFPLSVTELGIIMHKIANKQLLIKQDWTKVHTHSHTLCRFDPSFVRHQCSYNMVKRSILKLRSV